MTGTPVRLPPATERKLRRIAALEGVSLHEAIARALDELEDVLRREREADEVIRDLGMTGVAAPYSRVVRKRQSKRRKAGRKAAGARVPKPGRKAA